MINRGSDAVVNRSFCDKERMGDGRLNKTLVFNGLRDTP